MRRITEQCDSLESFVLHHAVCGGTGSGLASAIAERMSDMFPKIMKTNFVVGYERSSSASVVGPINATLGLAKLNQHTDVTIVVDNSSIQNIAAKNLDIKLPNYKNTNSLISQINASYSVFNRFNNNQLNCDLKDIQTNLVLYPKIHYAIPSFAPLIEQDQIYKWG